MDRKNGNGKRAVKDLPARKTQDVKGGLLNRPVDASGAGTWVPR